MVECGGRKVLTNISQLAGTVSRSHCCTFRVVVHGISFIDIDLGLSDVSPKRALVMDDQLPYAPTSNKD